MGTPVRLVRRILVDCPHQGRVAEIHLEMSPTGAPALVLRCSAAAGQPPRCDQACRTAADVVLRPVEALILLPPGTGIAHDVD